MPKLFVTGGTGFLGGYFIKQALKEGFIVRAITRKSPPFELDHLEWILGGLGEYKTEWMDGIDAIVHIASAGVSPKPISWQEALQINLCESLGLFQFANELGVNKWVVIGSCMEYGLSGNNYEFIPVDAELIPVGPYATSKAAFYLTISAFCREKRAYLSYLRPFHFFGDGQYEKNFWPSLKAAAIAGLDFPMTKGEQIRDFISVQAVVEEVLQHTCELLELKKPQIKIKNIGSGVPRTLRSFAEEWWHFWKAKGQLLVGAMPYRENEIFRLVPNLTPKVIFL
ncbi:MAG: NAD(P)-dependent oxidoreductase [Chthoniobacterales bacterium]|nr:NAD(P)-dependent oxidoreductase [Chthoniobacterales bacterium]